MSYTRPAYDMADASWVGAAAYTRPAYDAADATFVDPYDVSWAWTAYAPSVYDTGPFSEWSITLYAPDIEIGSSAYVTWSWEAFAPEITTWPVAGDLRNFLPGYAFDGTVLSFPLTALPGLTTEQAAELTGDVRNFIWRWYERVWSWRLAQTYLDTSMLCMPVADWNPDSAAFPNAIQRRYYLQMAGTAFDVVDWSGRPAPSTGDTDWWKLENLFAGWQFDGTRILIPLIDIIGLSSADADVIGGNAHVVILAVAQNIYDWRRKLPHISETIRVDAPVELYDYQLKAWWSTFDQYLYIDAYGNLPAGNLVGE